MTAVPDKFYFPSLNGLRAIAAFIVLFTHIERYRQIAGLPYIVSSPVNSFIGGLAVTFFFVLSGFLITSLLVREKTATNSIRIGRFLKKRMLRIWPLYYAVLIAGYLISIFLLKDTPPGPWSNGLLLNFLLLPNITFVLNRIPEILIQIWSIGTEEQFYFLWPFLVKTLRIKTLATVFAGIVVGWFVARMVIGLTAGRDSFLNAFLFRTRIDCMAIGGLAALRVTIPGKSMSGGRMELRPAGGWIITALLAGLLWISWRLNASIYQCYAVLFAFVILKITHQPVRLLETRPLKYLGKISYGIYLLHHFWVYFVFRTWLGRTGFLQDSPAGDLIAFGLVSLLTVASATLSYELFEKRFLKRKPLS